MAKDFYRVLGVAPDADQVVIAAAYRALAAKYHPDRSSGNLQEATARMAELNVAYETLRDASRRAEFDCSRPQQDAWSEEDAEQTNAFEEALSELEDRWRVAVSVFPELHPIRQALSRTSTALSFAFVQSILETKQFAAAERVAYQMERSFLQRYFGDQPEILEFAKRLIATGERAAVRELNKLIDVLGSSVDPKVLINKVESAFNLTPPSSRDAKRRVTVSDATMARIQVLRPKLLETASLAAAIEIASYLKYRVDVSGTFSAKYTVRDLLSGHQVHVRVPVHEFMRWAQDALS